MLDQTDHQRFLVRQTFSNQQRQGLLEFDAPLSQAALIEGVALDQVVLESTGGPLAELYTALGFDSVAYGDDDIEVIVVDVSPHLTFALLTNYPEFPDSCLIFQLPSA